MTRGGSSIPEVQGLLAALVASKPGGKVAEIGTAFGEGAKAILSALPLDATFVTVEPDAARYARARDALAGTRAGTIHARWQETLPGSAPFDLIFFDGGTSEEIAEAIDEVVDLLSVGGILVKDDLSPGIPIDADPVRMALFNHPDLAAVELLVTTEMAVVIATRRSPHAVT